MAALSFVLTALLLSVTFKAAEAAQLTINPPSLTLSGNSSVGTIRFTCAPGTTVAQGDLLSLVISRVATSGLGQQTALGSASTRANNGVAKMDTAITGATIEGSLVQQSITITMTETTCGADEATYICTSAAYGGAGGLIISAEDRKNFTVDVTAGTVSMTQDPLETRYLVNDTLTMRCNGLVGSNLPSVKIDWVWQYKDRTGFSYNDYVRSEDIVNEGIFQDTSNRCQYRQVSTLTRQITMEDDGREYQCFVRRNNVPSVPDSQHSASYTIGAVYEGQVPDTGNTDANTGSSAPAKANVGAIVGGVIGGLILIAIIVVLVYFLVIRKRRQEAEAYPGNKAGEEPIPYTGSYPAANTNADVMYSKPARFQKNTDRGVTNKGMDEPTHDEKPPSYEKKPDRYQNEKDYRRGGRNPGYDHGEDRDTRNRRYSSDDGGTDRDVNTSMHSINSRGTGDPTMGTAI